MADPKDQTGADVNKNDQDLEAQKNKKGKKEEEVTHEFLAGCEASVQREWLRNVYTVLLLQLCLIVGAAYGLSKFPEAITWLNERLWVIAIIGVFLFFNLTYLAGSTIDKPMAMPLAIFTILKTFLWGYLIDALGQTNNCIRVLFITIGVFAGQVVYNWKTEEKDKKVRVWTQGALFTSLLTGGVAAYLVYVNMPFDSTKALALSILASFILTVYIKTTTYVSGLTKVTTTEEGGSKTVTPPSWMHASAGLYFAAIGVILVPFYSIREYLRGSYSKTMDLLREDVKRITGEIDHLKDKGKKKATTETAAAEAASKDAAPKVAAENQV